MYTFARASVFVYQVAESIVSHRDLLLHAHAYVYAHVVVIDPRGKKTKLEIRIIRGIGNMVGASKVSATKFASAGKTEEEGQYYSIGGTGAYLSWLLLFCVPIPCFWALYVCRIVLCVVVMSQVVAHELAIAHTDTCTHIRAHMYAHAHLHTQRIIMRTQMPHTHPQDIEQVQTHISIATIETYKSSRSA